MASKLVELFVIEGIAVMLFVFAYLIGVRGRLNLIAGYSERSARKIKDKDGLKRLVTRLCLLLGIVTALLPLLTYVAAQYPAGLAYSVGAYGGFVAGVIAITLLQARDYVV